MRPGSRLRRWFATSKRSPDASTRYRRNFCDVDRAREKTRLQSTTDSASASQVVVNDIEVNLRHLTRRIDELTRQATRLVESDEQLRAAYGHLVSVRGIAQKSAVLLLGELATLPDDMSVRQWVGITGDPPTPASTRKSTSRAHR